LRSVVIYFVCRSAPLVKHQIPIVTIFVKVVADR
jgi:hypothetical protein